MWAVVALISLTAAAQDWDFGGGYESSRHNFGLEVGVGGTGDVTVDIGVKWQLNLHEFVAWDVITAKALADVENDFSDSITAQLLSGLRLTTPDFSGLSAYATAKFGYAYQFDAEDGSFAYELGIGINATRRVYFGFAYNTFKIDDIRIKYNAFRIGFLF